MRRRWYYWKQTLRANRPLLFLFAGFLLAFSLVIRGRKSLEGMAKEWFQIYGVRTAGYVMKDWFPSSMETENDGFRGWFSRQNPLLSYLEALEINADYSEDPAYERMLAEEWIRKENDQSNGKGTGHPGQSEQTGQAAGGENGQAKGQTNQAAGQTDRAIEGQNAEDFSVGEVIAAKPVSQTVIREKLADYDYMMKSFYSVHPTTTAGREMMSAEKFLSMDLSLEKEADAPQVLIYHTHSQEEFADYPENPEATIVGAGTYLAELLEQKGYHVIHDTSVYDFRDGKLDRSKAYTYALDGITGILQKYPSIEVVLDIHRDGVKEGTHLVTEIGGKQTAQIMFFNGTSQTPDGPIEYLPNPNRDANMAFSFQMQLLAAEKYPGFTRKIYLKGLRYNQHVRARTALVEVGAQTNTYEEARNAMEPLSELLDGVLSQNDSGT